MAMPMHLPAKATNRVNSPEQEELDEKNLQMCALEADFTSRQLDFTTLEGEVVAFRNRYFLRVGSLYAQLDAIRAEVCAQLAKLTPHDAAAKQAAEQARRQAEEIAEEINGADEDEPITFAPSADLKQLYRQAAKLIHPDRAKNEEDRLLRDRLMADINKAYEAGDAEAIAEITEKYRDRLSTDDSEDIGTRLVRVIRLIAKTRNRIATLDQAIEVLRASEWYKLKVDVEEKEARGEDPLGQLAEKVQTDILAEQKRLEELFTESNAAQGAAPPSLRGRAYAEKAAGQAPATTADIGATPSDMYCCRTQRGDMVRTKSEAMIANVLHSQGIDYRYEYPVEGRTRHGIRRASFLIFDAHQKPILWQHLGPLNDAEHRARWAARLDWFEANGFTQNANLFITRDRDDGSIDAQLTGKLAATVKGLVAP